MTRPTSYTQAEFDEAGTLGERDGYEKAVSDIDRLTGGDGEYRVSTQPDRHCPDVETMKARILATVKAHGGGTRGGTPDLAMIPSGRLVEFAAAISALQQSTASDDGVLTSTIGERVLPNTSSLLPEGRSEQDQGGETASWSKIVRELGDDLAAARLRIKALEASLRPFARAHELRPAWMDHPDYDLEQIHEGVTAGDLRRAAALLSSAQGETKEGFDGLPESPCTDAGPSPRSPDPWQTMNRTRLIEVAREWAANAMARHDNNTRLAQSLRDADFYRADALNEFAAFIEAGEFDSVRPSAPYAAALVEGE